MGCSVSNLQMKNSVVMTYISHDILVSSNLCNGNQEVSLKSAQSLACNVSLLTYAGPNCQLHVLFLYQNPSATNKVLDRDGWLNTGDVGWIVPHHSTGRSCNSGGVIVVDGRAKDTIVLSTGRTVC